MDTDTYTDTRYNTNAIRIFGVPFADLSWAERRYVINVMNWDS